MSIAMPVTSEMTSAAQSLTMLQKVAGYNLNAEFGGKF